jgi:hypothetical protein
MMNQIKEAQATKVATWSELTDRQPAYALAANVLEFGFLEKGIEKGMNSL